MYYINENTVKDTVDQSSINQVIEDVFISLTRNDAFNFPVVRDSLDYRDAIFGFKSAFDRSGPTLAIKAGGLWPSNRDLGLPNHQSTIMLFDPETGGPYALVLGTYLTALRTAAASALSIRALARDNAKALGVVGAGGQALYQVHAAMAEREFERVYIYDENEKNAQALANSLANDVEAIVEVSPALLAPQSDVIITITPSRKPILNL
ncbi:MAG: ornithine cyclodeaminase family protein, partial [Pseudomonadota bacterium]